MKSKSILQVVIEEEYERSLSHLDYLLANIPKTPCNKRERFREQIKTRVSNIKFAMKCLDIEYEEDVVIKSKKFMGG